MPTIDLPRLRRDLKRHRESRLNGQHSRGRPLTGSMAIVREHLEAFEAMHRDGASWVDIAAGLAAQGVTQGAGEAAQPITARRLTALMASVRRERERHARTGRARTQRTDVLPTAAPKAVELAAPLPVPVPVPPSVARSGPERIKLSLASELAPREPDEAPSPVPSAEDLRRSALTAVQMLLKKDP